MGKAYAHSSQHAQSCGNYKGVFRVVEPQSVEFFAPFHNRRDMDELQNTRHQAAVETVRISERISSEEGPCGSVRQQSHGDSFFAMYAVNSQKLSGTENQ